MTHLPTEFRDWLSYLDDVLVYSTDLWGHLEHLRKVVQAHTRAGIKNQPQKTKIFQSEVDYLGHKVINPIPAGGGEGSNCPPL